LSNNQLCFHRLHPSRFHRRDQGREVAFRLVGVSLGKRGRRTVESYAFAQVAGDLGYFAPLGMRSRQDPASVGGVGGEGRRRQRVERGTLARRALPAAK